MKKMVSLILCLALFITMSLPAFATSDISSEYTRVGIIGTIMHEESCEVSSSYAPTTKGVTTGTSNGTIEYGTLLIAILYLYRALCDWLGVQFHIPKRYWHHPRIQAWQKKRTIPELVISSGAWIVFFSSKDQIAYYVVGCIVAAIGFILLHTIDSTFKKSVSS